MVSAATPVPVVGHRFRTIKTAGSKATRHTTIAITNNSLNSVIPALVS